MTNKIDPIRQTDDDARDLGRSLLLEARFAALGVTHPSTGLPHVTRIAFKAEMSGALTTLVSDLALHSRALRQNAACSLLVGDVPDKGDPLAFPRMTVAAEARFVTREDGGYADLREAWLASHPKSALYVDFADFHFVRFKISGADLNGGFGKAYTLAAKDLFPE